MTIIERNYFRLLRAGAYGSEEVVEPMSAWKWRQLLAIARKLDMAALLADGVKACSNQFFAQMPADVVEEWNQATTTAEQRHQEVLDDVALLLQQQATSQLRPILTGLWASQALYPIPSHHCTGLVSIYFPYATQGKKADDQARAIDANATNPNKHVLHYTWQGLSVEHRHCMLQLSNKLNNHTLKDIIEKEWLEGGTSHIVVGQQRIETMAPTLAMLVALVEMVKTTLANGVSLWQLLDIGMMLRQLGDRMDFVKIESWIDRLHFQRMAMLTAQLLTGLLGFSTDEVPFVREFSAKADIDALASGMLGTQGTKAARFTRYCLGESMMNTLASIGHSIGNVEE